VSIDYKGYSLQVIGHKNSMLCLHSIHGNKIATIRLESGTTKGNVKCNMYFARWTTRDGYWRYSGLYATRLREIVDLTIAGHNERLYSEVAL